VGRQVHQQHGIACMVEKSSTPEHLGPVSSYSVQEQNRSLPRLTTCKPSSDRSTGRGVQANAQGRQVRGRWANGAYGGTAQHFSRTEEQYNRAGEPDQSGKRNTTGRHEAQDETRGSRMRRVSPHRPRTANPRLRWASGPGRGNTRSYAYWTVPEL
jgi:hypothetical protein